MYKQIIKDNTNNVSLINTNSGVIENLFIKDAVVVGSYSTRDDSYTSGFVGINNGTIRNVSFVGDVISTAKYTANVIGLNNGVADTIINNGIPKRSFSKFIFAQ